LKHLKRFNESSDYDWELERDDYQDFCDTYLAYLTDEDFKVTLTNFDKHRKTIYILKEGEKGGWLYNPDVRANATFEWDEIKDSFIPFLTLLERKCEGTYYLGDVDSSVFFPPGTMGKGNLILFNHELDGKSKYDYVPLQDLLDDKVDFIEITSIQITLNILPKK
jgi:hypothetical protein